MAEMDVTQLSLLSLADELICSICLCTFDCPVTIPCGHNFCQTCLLASWTDTYSCPQCRTQFATRPELKKNTVLSTVVKTFNLRSNTDGEVTMCGEGKKEVIRCDTCMQAEASHTCLTCMASFCEEHLRPHRENPTFRLHQLSAPVGDLSERICPDHSKMMEFFCSQHSRPICSMCLQQVHKSCSFNSPEEQRDLKQTEMRDKLGLLDDKIMKNESVLCQMRDLQNKLKELAISKKKVMETEFQQMRDMLTQEEIIALNAVDREVESGQTKIRSLMKKFSENVDTMSRAKEDIHSLLSQSHTLAFLQASVNLPQAVSFDPFTPRINLDSKRVIATEVFTAALKELLTDILRQPVENRLQLIKPGERAASASGFTSPSSGISKESEPPRQPRPSKSQSPGPASQPKPGKEEKKKPAKQTKKHPQSTKGMTEDQIWESLLEFLEKETSGGRSPKAEPNQKPETSDIPLNIATAEKRSELLKYGAALTYNRKTVHKRIILSEGFTKASVTDEQENYPDCPQRFAICSQVLATKGFSTGRHYWEVRLSGNNFMGVGLAYKSIDRKGPASRLGRNTQSWCVEWFNAKLSAWHDSTETVLDSSNPKRVGVLLDFEEGRATFYNVADRAYPFYSFVVRFAEAVYPAFWIFSSGSSITLCKIQT